MQTYLKQIQTFINSPLCIFNLSPIDYPQTFQQQLINSYFYVSSLIQRSHNQIIRQLNTQSQKQTKQIAQGFLYMLILDKNNIQKFLQYVMLLRIQVWNLLAANFQMLLAQYADILRNQCKVNIVDVFKQLVHYHMESAFGVRLISDLLTFENLNPDGMELMNNILKMFLEFYNGVILLSPELIHGICLYLFPRLIRMYPYINWQLCIQLITSILQNHEELCLACPTHVLYLIKMNALYKTIPILSNLQHKILSLPIQQSQQSVIKTLHQTQQSNFQLLPRKIQIIFQYIFKEDIKGNQLIYHLNWIQKNWQNKRIQYAQILIDITRWVGFLGQFLQQRIIILQWAYRKANGFKGDYMERIRRSIFYNWFVPQYRYEIVGTSIVLLRHFLAVDSINAIEMLKHILRHVPDYAVRIRQILLAASQLNQFKLEYITDNRVIPAGLKQDIIQLYQQKTQYIKEKEKQQEALHFNPDSPIKSDQGQGPNYNEQICQIAVKYSQVSKINLQQQFAGEFDMELQNVLDNPDYQNFGQFIKKLIRIAAQARNKNKQLIPILLTQAAKVIYCAYNNQFQQISNKIKSQKSIIVHLLNLLIKQWHQVTHRTQFIKNLVKRIIELFPTAQIAFWFYFIMDFQYDAGNSRKFKTWLIPKQKAKFVQPAVQIILGKVDQNFRNRYQKYTNFK